MYREREIERERGEYNVWRACLLSREKVIKWRWYFFFFLFWGSSHLFLSQSLSTSFFFFLIPPAWIQCIMKITDACVPNDDCTIPWSSFSDHDKLLDIIFTPYTIFTNIILDSFRHFSIHFLLYCADRYTASWLISAPRIYIVRFYLQIRKRSLHLIWNH